MQYNWPDLAEVPDILAALAEVQMHAIQTSGNCIRNVTTDEFAGVAADEVFDRGLLRTDPAMVDLTPGIRLAAAQIQDRDQRLGHDRAAIDMHDIGLRVIAMRTARTGGRESRRRTGADTSNRRD